MSKVRFCDTGDIFEIECQNDFKVKVDVLDLECFTQEYPASSLTDLVVYASEENDVSDSNTCKSYTGSETGSNHIYGNADLSSAVTTTSSSLFFDGKVCSSDASFSDSDSVLLYTAKLATYVHNPSVTMLFNTAMLAVNFQCKYKQSVDGEIPIGSMILDKPKNDGETKVDDADISSLTITPIVSVEQLDGTFKEVTDNVILGEKVKLTFKSSADTLNIHIGSCIAGDKATNPTNSLPLVDQDCFKTSTSGALSFVEPTDGGSTCDDVCQTEMTMNQFAFIDPSSSDDQNPDLVFHMTCSIEVGEPTCNSRKRRQTDETQVVEFSYSVNATQFTIDEGVVHALESISSFKHLAPFTLFVMAFTLF